MLRNVGSHDLAASQQLYDRAAHITRMTVAEASGTSAAEIRIWDGHDVNGQLVYPVKLAAGAMFDTSAAEPGAPCTSGIYLEVRTGSVHLGLTFDDGS